VPFAADQFVPAADKNLTSVAALPPPMGIQPRVSRDREDPWNEGFRDTVRVSGSMDAHPEVLQGIFSVVHGGARGDEVAQQTRRATADELCDGLLVGRVIADHECRQISLPLVIQAGGHGVPTSRAL
jgi:hypothetical protein